MRSNILSTLGIYNFVNENHDSIRLPLFITPYLLMCIHFLLPINTETFDCKMYLFRCTIKREIKLGWSAFERKHMSINVFYKWWRTDVKNMDIERLNTTRNSMHKIQRKMEHCMVDIAISMTRVVDLVILWSFADL